jgi:glycosyltransferase involved in cell wall biosynthesis
MAALPSPDRHGAQLRNVIKALAPRFHVEVMALKGLDQAVVERYLGARLLRVPAHAGSLEDQIDAFRRAVRRQLEGEEYDVIHFRDAWSGLPISERKGDLSAKIVYDVALSPQGEPRAADRDLAATLFQSESYCLERSDLILVPTETARRHLERAGFGGRVAVVPPGVDIDHFDWEPAPTPPRPVIMYAGRIAPGRRVRLLLEAAALLRADHDFEVWLVGPVDESLRKPLDETVANLGIADRVREWGPVDHDDIPRVLARASICVVPGAADETERPLASPPTKLLEYMACRRPVIAPNRPCVTEIIRQGVEGLLFAPGDGTDLAACLRRLLTDSSFSGELAAAGYHAVRDRYPASAARRRLLEAYSRLVAPDSHRGVHPTQASPLDVLPAHADTTMRRDSTPPVYDEITFEASGALLGGGIPEKMKGNS